ncbi:MAG: TIGR03620 family F420-dependent LLM class oxidoreductase [Actinomycetota bacterium]
MGQVLSDPELEAARGRLRRTIGPIGVWSFAFDVMSADDEAATARAIEDQGFPVLWIPEGSGSKEALAHAGHLLSSTDRLVVATGIANMWARDPQAAASGARTLGEAYPGRFILGVGAGHGYSAALRGSTWERPFTRMAGYVEAIAEAPYGGPQPEPPVPLLLAALGPRMLGLAAAQTAGAHSYFVPVAHTEVARRALGPDPFLAVEQTVIPLADGDRALEVARSWARHYLELPNYADNLRRFGFSDDDVRSPGSDRLLEATMVWGGVDAIVERVRAHLDAGADHVCVQVIEDEDGATVRLDVLAEVFAALR